MFSLFTKKTTYPEFQNLTESNTNFIQVESEISTIVQSLYDPSNNMIFSIGNLSNLISLLQKISDSLNVFSQTASAINQDLIYLQKLNEQYSKKKSFFDQKKSDEYQKEIVSRITAVINMISEERKKESAEIIQKIDGVKQESFNISFPRPEIPIDIQKLQKIVAKNEQNMSEEVSFENEDDDLVIITESDLISNSFSFPSEDENEEMEPQKIEDSIDEQQRKEQELIEQQRKEQELVEQQRKEQELVEQQRKEQELLEQQRKEQELIEQQRKEQELVEQQRKEQELVEQQRKEQELLEQQRKEQELIEKQKREQELRKQQKREQYLKWQQKKEQQLKEQQRKEQTPRKPQKREQAPKDQQKREQKPKEQQRKCQELKEEQKRRQELFERQNKILFNQDLLIQQRLFGQAPKENQKKDLKEKNLNAQKERDQKRKPNNSNGEKQIAMNQQKAIGSKQIIINNSCKDTFFNLQNEQKRSSKTKNQK
ncbi:hypothetical protein M9Y10_036759 [Tritrichomonas musculus]|uniref:Uncharacterized protein n=1 Tax=Tritrichomonas musculus TaxID=1915356 RepID=A0ABR2GTX9_9EUKA